MTDDLRQAIGIRVKTARNRAGLSQEALAARIKRTPESVSNIERGVQLPAIDTLIDLMAVLELSIKDLFEDASNPRTISRERAELEARIVETIRGLSQTSLTIAAEQIDVLKALK